MDVRLGLLRRRLYGRVLFSGEHDMNAITSCGSAVARGAAISVLVLSLIACAGQPTESQAPPTAEGAISPEDAEQVPIPVRSSRERAAETAGGCGDDRTPGSRVVECTSAGANRALERISF